MRIGKPISGASRRRISISGRRMTYSNIGGGSPDPTYGTYGTGVYGDTLFNEKIGHTNQAVASYRFRAEQSSDLNSVRVYTVVYHEGDYSAGDAGSIRARLYADDGTSNHFPTGSVLATSNTFSPGNPPSTDFPVLTFSPAYTVTAGTLYHIVFDNPHATPTTDYHSLDMMSDLTTAYSPQQPRFNDVDWAYLVKYGAGSWGQRTQNVTPIADITYANGSHQGMGYMEVGIQAATVNISGNTMIREVFTVSGGTRTVKGVGLYVSRYSGTGDLSARLETSGGSEIETVVFDADEVALSTQASYPNWGTTSRVYKDFGSTHELANNTSYRLRLSAPSGTTYRTHSIKRGTSYGFNSVTYFADGYAQKTTDGSNWGEVRTNWSGDEDMMFYFKTIE